MKGRVTRRKRSTTSKARRAKSRTRVSLLKKSERQKRGIREIWRSRNKSRKKKNEKMWVGMTKMATRVRLSRTVRGLGRKTREEGQK